MKRTFLSCCILLCTLCSVCAQEQPLISPDDSIRSLLGRIFPNTNPNLSAHMNLEFYTSGAAYFTDGNLDEAAFKLNRVRLEILGSFTKDFSYHFRQSFNKYSNPHSLDNLSSSIEYAYMNWKMSDRFNLTVGKQFLSLGGYEYYVNAIKVREFSEFNDNVPAYQAGVTGTFNFSPTQELVLQVLNNRNGEDNDTYVYGLPAGVNKTKIPIITTLNWNGLFVDKALQLRYAAAWGQLAEGKNIYYLTAGNVYEKGPVIAYIDVMYSREGLDSKGIISDCKVRPWLLLLQPRMQNTSAPLPILIIVFIPIGMCMSKEHTKRQVFTRQTASLRKVFTVLPGMPKLVWSISRCVIVNC